MPNDSYNHLPGLKIWIGSHKNVVIAAYGSAHDERYGEYRHNGLRITFDKNDTVIRIELKPYKDEEKVVLPSIDLQKVRSEIGKEDVMRKMWHYGGLVDEYIWQRDGFEIMLCVVASEVYESGGSDTFIIKEGDIQSLVITKSFSAREREENNKFVDKFFENFDIFYKYSAYYGGYVYRNREIIKILDKNKDVRFSHENNELVYFDNTDNDAYKKKSVNSEKIYFNEKEIKDAKTHLLVDGRIYYTKVERLIAALDHHENCLSEMSLWCNDKKLTNFILYHYEGNYSNAVISANPDEIGPFVWIYDEDNYVVMSRPQEDKNKFSYAAWDTEFLINGYLYTNENLDHVTSLYLIMENNKIIQILAGESACGFRGKHFVHNLEDGKQYFLYLGSKPISIQRKVKKPPILK